MKSPKDTKSSKDSNNQNAAVNPANAQHQNAPAITGFINVRVSNINMNGFWSGVSPKVWMPTGPNSTINIVELLSALQTGANVIINTTSGNGRDAGDIIFDADLNADVLPTTLVLNAANQISLNGAFVATPFPNENVGLHLILNAQIVTNRDQLNVSALTISSHAAQLGTPFSQYPAMVNGDVTGSNVGFSHQNINAGTLLFNANDLLQYIPLQPAQANQSSSASFTAAYDAKTAAADTATTSTTAASAANEKSSDTKNQTDKNIKKK